MTTMLRKAALLAASVLYLEFAPSQYFGRQQDEVLYLVAAKALAAGKYCHLTVPGCPPLVSATPGFPLLLSPLVALTEEPRVLLLPMLALGMLVPWAAWWWLRRRLSEDAALLGALLVGTSPLLLSQAGLLMTETPYLLLSLLFLALVEDGKAKPSGALWLLLTQMRPAGLSLAPVLLRWRKPRAAAALAWAAAPAALGALAWTAWSRAASGSVQEGAELGAAYAGQWSRVPAVVLDNLRFLLGALGGAHLPPAQAYGPLSLLLGALIAGAAVWGCAALLRRRADDAGVLALLGAAGMHLVWPWQYERYLIPLLPLIWRGGAEALGRKAGRVLGALLVAQLGFQVLPRLRPAAGPGASWDRPELLDSYLWLREQPGAWVLASALPLRDGWWSRHPAVSLPAEPEPERFAAALRASRVRYVLQQDELDLGFSDPRGARTLSALREAQGHLADKRLFRPVFEQRKARIYELR